MQQACPLRGGGQQRAAREGVVGGCHARGGPRSLHHDPQPLPPSLLGPGRESRREGGHHLRSLLQREGGGGRQGAGREGRLGVGQGVSRKCKNRQGGVSCTTASACMHVHMTAAVTALCLCTRCCTATALLVCNPDEAQNSLARSERARKANQHITRHPESVLCSQRLTNLDHCHSLIKAKCHTVAALHHPNGPDALHAVVEGVLKPAAAASRQHIWSQPWTWCGVSHNKHTWLLPCVLHACRPVNRCAQT